MQASRAEQISRLQTLVDQIGSVRASHRYSALHVKWITQVRDALDSIFGHQSRYTLSFAALTWSLVGSRALPPRTFDIAEATARINEECFEADLEKARGFLEAALDRLRIDPNDVFVRSVTDDNDTLPRLVSQLKRFADGLSRIRRLNTQGKDGVRPAFRLANEYDLQDALWVLIRPQFPDAVSESPTPKTGLAWSRTDLWLPTQSIAIEVKYARSMADAKRLDAELKKDFVDYQAAGAQAVIALIMEAPNAHGLEELDNLEHTVRVPAIRIVRSRL